MDIKVPRIFRRCGKAIWCHAKWSVFKYGFLVYLALCLVGVALMIWIRKVLGVQTYDIRDILTAIPQIQRVKQLPEYIGIIVFFILLPLMLSILGRYTIERILLPFNCSKILRKLSDRCLHLSNFGRTWLGKTVHEVLGEVESLGGKGVQWSVEERKGFCDALYRETYSKKVHATCLQNIGHLYNDQNEKAYLEDTMQTTNYLDRFGFVRFIVTSENFDNLFTNTPGQDLKWLVKLHSVGDVELYHITMRTFKERCVANSIPDDYLDVLHFDGLMVIALQTNPALQNKVVTIPPHMKNFVRAFDSTNSKEIVRSYKRLFAALPSVSTNVIPAIRQKGWATAYDIP